MEEMCRNDEGCLEKVFNINFSMNKYKELLNKYITKKESFALCLINIRGFKLYNHVFGRELGDSLLYNIYMNFKRYMNRRGEVYRFGSDILLFVLPDIPNKYHAECILKDIFNRSNRPYNIMEHKIKVKFNIGAAIFPDDSNDLEELFNFADAALYHSRQHSNKGYKFFNYNLYEKFIQKEKTEVEIFNAIYKNELTLYYQPQVNLETRKIFGMEALIRWKHPKRGIVSPVAFIDIIENDNIIIQVGQWIIEEACFQIKAWNKLGFNDLRVSVNISERQLEDGNFFNLLQEILSETGTSPKQLCIEITERTLLKSKDTVINNLTQINKLGVKIFLDDFGSVYSSLSYLYKFPIDGLKIDKAFIDNITENTSKFIITRNIIELAKDLRMDVVAEGVENIEQLNCLKELNCPKIQGYIYGKPEDPNSIVKLLEYYNR